jgi:hypothetical protein
LYEAYLALEHRLPRPREEYEAMFDELNQALEEALEDLLAPRVGQAASQS